MSHYQPFVDPPKHPYYSYPYSAEVVQNFLERYPRATTTLAFFFKKQRLGVHIWATRAFRTNQVRWRSIKKLVKELEYDADLRKAIVNVSIKFEDRKKYLTKVMQICEDFALDSLIEEENS